MGFTAVVIKALKWIGRAFSWYRYQSADIKVIQLALKRFGWSSKTLEKLFARLEKVERTVGSKTDAWNKIKKAAQFGEAADLDIADTKYLYQFKKAFDTLKKPFVS